MCEKKHIEGIIALKLIFMLMIFVHHCNFAYGGGGCAVSGFFLLSGFCLTLGYSGKVLASDFSWKNFMLKRAIKLYPLHWICLLLIWICSWHFHFGPKFFVSFGTNAALLQSWIPLKWMYFSFNSPSWYLCDILFFAAIFPFLIKLINRLSTTGRIFAITIPISIIVILSIFMPVDLRHAWLYVNPLSRLVDCLIGMYLAFAYMRLKQNKSFLASCYYHVGLIDIAIVLSLGFVIVQSITKFGCNLFYQTSFWIPNILLVSAIALRSLIDKESLVSKTLNSRQVSYLGECSLSFYLLHSIVMKGMGLINESLAANAKSIIGGGIVLFVTFILSRISYKLIEQKLTQYLNEKLIVNIIK